MHKKDVLGYFDGKRMKVAECLHITPQAVTLWGEIIPEAAATKLHIKTNGELQYREELYYPNVKK